MANGEPRAQTPMPRLASWLAQARPLGAERLQLVLLPLDGAPWVVRDWYGAELPPLEASFQLAQSIFDIAHGEADGLGTVCRFGIRWLDATGESRAQTVIRILPTRAGQENAAPTEHPFNFTDDVDASATGVLGTSLRHHENTHRQMLIAQSDAAKSKNDSMQILAQHNAQLAEQNRLLFGVALELVRGAAAGGAGAADDPVKAAHAVGLETAYRALAETVVPQLPQAVKAVFERTSTGKSKGGRNYVRKTPPKLPAPAASKPGNGKAPH